VSDENNFLGIFPFDSTVGCSQFVTTAWKSEGRALSAAGLRLRREACPENGEDLQSRGPASETKFVIRNGFPQAERNE